MSAITTAATAVLDAVAARDQTVTGTDLDVALGRVQVEFAEAGFSATIDAMAQLPAALGQTNKAGSLSVTLASNQDALPVTDNGGSLTVDGTVAVSTVTTVTAVTGITNVVHVDDNSGSLTVDGSLTSVTTVGTITNVVHVDDNSGSLTVDGSLTSVGTVTTVTGITNVVHVDDNSGSLTVDGSVSITGTAAVSMANLPTPPSAIFAGGKTVTTAGTRVALASTQALKKGVMIRAATSNTGLIYVGTAAGVSSSAGYELAPGECLPEILPVADLASVGLDSSVNSQSVTYIAS